MFSSVILEEFSPDVSVLVSDASDFSATFLSSSFFSTALSASEASSDFFSGLLFDLSSDFGVEVFSSSTGF